MGGASWDRAGNLRETSGNVTGASCTARRWQRLRKWSGLKRQLRRKFREASRQPSGDERQCNRRQLHGPPPATAAQVFGAEAATCG
jgi:hypothetical protein